MPKPTQGEIIHELTKSVAAVTENLKHVAQDVRALEPLLERAAVPEQQVAQLADLKRELATVTELRTLVALLQREVEELKRLGEEASKKRWSVVPPVVGAIVSALLAALVAHFVSRR